MVFTCAGQNFGKPKHSCTSLWKGLSQTFKENKKLTARQVLIAKLMDELIKEKKPKPRYKATKSLSHKSLGAGTVLSCPFTLHWETAVTTTRNRMWRMRTCSLPRHGHSYIHPKEGPNLLLTGKALANMPKSICSLSV